MKNLFISLLLLCSIAATAQTKPTTDTLPAKKETVSKEKAEAPEKNFTITLNEQQTQVLLTVLAKGKLDGMSGEDAMYISNVIIAINNQVRQQINPPKK